jgi:peptidoglycan/LPS O-acetylase OafA/YrhL
MIRLDGVRGVLAVYVMLGHAAPMVRWPPLAGRIIEALVSHGFAAVTLFFALSGLVIVQSLTRFEGRTLPFLIARGRRILPVYLVVLGFAIIVLCLPDPFARMPWLTPGDAAHQIWEDGLPQPLWAHLAVHLALLQGVLPRHLLPYGAFSLLGPAWSLSAEVQFYLLIALLARRPMARLAAPRTLVLIFAALALLAAAYRQAAPETWQFSRAFLPNAALYFALGIASVQVLREGRVNWLFAIVMGGAIGLGAASGQWLRALTPLGWGLCLLVQARPDLAVLRPAARLLGSRPVLWLGAISYPLYLVNEPVQRLLALTVSWLAGANQMLFETMWTLLAIGLPIICAAGLHYGLERPFMKPWRRPRQGFAAMELVNEA